MHIYYIVSVNSSVDEVKKYLNDVDYLPACNFCKGRSYSAAEIKPAIQTQQPLEYKKF